MHHLHLHLHHITHFLLHYGYFAVFTVILFEDFGLPVPGETVLVTACILAGTGHFNIVLVLALAFLGAVIGDNIGYAIGFFGGRRLVLKYGNYVYLKEKHLVAVEDFFRKYGNEVVAIARFFSGPRQLNGIIAGIGEMPWWHFLVFNILGAALWVGSWGLLAYFFGRKSGNILAAFKQLELFVLPLILLVILVAFLIRFLRHRKNHARA
jgi:membrane protein DedA with SNARE-associated domain